MADLGYATFPGIAQILSARYTLAHGITPGVCEVEVVPQDDPIGLGGTLAFHWGVVTIAIPGCKADLATARRTENGLVWSLGILDKRWRWRYGEIYGEYNRKGSDGQTITATRKTPQQLATLCFQAMGESTFDVSLLPNTAEPEVFWDGQAPPAVHLADLVESLGCTIVLKIDGSVKIEPQGLGGQLPELQTILDATLAVDPPETPSAIRVLSDRTRVQARLRLRAVGRDTDRSIKLINDLSYTPTNGWALENDLFSNVTDDEENKLAIETVWRWYRVDVTASVLQPPEFAEPITSEEQILPVLNELVETFEDSSGVVRQKPAKIVGLYWIRNIGAPVNSTTSDHYDYPGDFQLDSELGIVKFPVQVKQWVSETAGWTQAELYLDCSFEVRSIETRAPHRYSYLLPLSAFGAGVEVVHRPEVKLGIYEQRSSPESSPTWHYIRDPASLDSELRHYAEGAAQKYAPLGTADASYGGLVVIQPDGAIWQVTWQVGGPGPAITHASRNSETDPYTPPYRQRRFFEKGQKSLGPQGVRINVPGLGPGIAYLV